MTFTHHNHIIDSLSIKIRGHGGREGTCGDEPAVVLHPLVGPAPGLLLLVLLRHFGGLPPHLPGASQRSVHLP